MAEASFKALFFGPFRMLVKTKERDYTLTQDSPTINDLVDKIIADFPESEEYFFTGEEINEQCSIIINGEDVRAGIGLKTPIVPNDRITFFKAAGGG